MVRTRPSKLAVAPDRHRRRWRPKRPNSTTSNPSPTSSSKVNHSNSSRRLPSSSKLASLTNSNKTTLPLAEEKVRAPVSFLLTLGNLISYVEGPSVRRACATCHAGKTRCSEVLPCQVRSRLMSIFYVSPEKRLSQSCLKRGLGATCAYPEPDSSEQPPGKLLSSCPDS